MEEKMLKQCHSRIKQYFIEVSKINAERDTQAYLKLIMRFSLCFCGNMPIINTFHKQAHLLILSTFNKAIRCIDFTAEYINTSSNRAYANYRIC